MLAVPVLVLVVAAAVVAIQAGTDGTSAAAVTMLIALCIGVIAGTTATLLFTRTLTRRISHLQVNAERLARDVDLEPAAPGTDEIAATEATLARAAEVLASRRRELEEARASLEHLVSAGPMVMFASSLSTRLDDPTPLVVDYISSNSARVMGHSPLAIADDPSVFLDLVHDDDRAALLAAARRAIGETRRQVRVEFRIRHLDGSWRWMEGILRGHETEPTRILAYAVDITSRRQAEEAQQQSESRLSAFLDNSSALISLKDPFGRYEFANQAFVAVLGDDPTSVVGSDDFDHWPESAPTLRARDQQVLVAREPMQFEESIPLADGTHTFLSVKFPLLDPDGMPVAVGTISTDITELKDAVETVAARERVMSTVIGASPDVITLLEADGTIRTTSIAFERIFGYPTRTLVDQPLFDLIHRDDRARTEAQFDQLSTGVRQRVTLRFRARRSDRTWITIESHAQLVEGPDGADDGVVMVSRDISEQIELEEALRRAKDEAERASNSKSEFLSRVSHELRTPLNAMLGFAQLLELEDLGESTTEYVGQITRAGDHLLALINEVLDIARIESERMHLRMEALPASAAVREVVDLAAPLAARAGVGLHGPTDGLDEVEVHADRQRLLQVLLNLVSNAIKYNHAGGRVDVEVSPRRDVVRISVHDTGPGLSEDQVERLFVPFDRLGLEHSGIEGTGVGLALSRGLTEHMGGTLGVHSEPGRGSTFWIELPCSPTDGPPLTSDHAGPTSSTRAIHPAPAPDPTLATDSHAASGGRR